MALLFCPTSGALSLRVQAAQRSTAVHAASKAAQAEKHVEALSTPPKTNENPTYLFSDYTRGDKRLHDVVGVGKKKLKHCRKQYTIFFFSTDANL